MADRWGQRWRWVEEGNQLDYLGRVAVEQVSDWWRMNVERKYVRTRIHRFALGKTFDFLLLNLGWWGRWMDQLVLLYSSVNDDDQHQMCQAREREQSVQPTEEESICRIVNQEKETLDWPTPLWHKWYYLQPDSWLLKQLSSRILFVIYLHKLGAFSSVLPNKKLLSYQTKHLLTSGCCLEDEGLPHQIAVQYSVLFIGSSYGQR